MNIGLIGVAGALAFAAIGSALGMGAAGMAAVGGWKKCFAQNKPAPFTLVIFAGAPLTQTIYGFILMNRLTIAAQTMDPALLLGAWAQWKVKSAFARGHKQPCRSGLSGAQAAARIIESHGLSGIRIEPTRGFLGDHYDPRNKVLRLSPDVYNGRSLAAVGVAAHEAGHALQDAHGYAPLHLRNGIVPMASLGSNLSIGLLFVGFLMQAAAPVLTTPPPTGVNSAAQFGGARLGRHLCKCSTMVCTR